MGSARSSSLSGRVGGSDAVRSIGARSSSRRRSCSKRRSWSRGRPSAARVVLGEVGLGLGAQAERAADALDVDAEDAGALAAAEGGDRQPREVAQRGLGAVAQRGGDLLAQRVEVDLAVSAAVASAPALPSVTPRRGGRGLGGAEEEALEDEVEDAPVLRGLGERRGQRLLEVGLLGPGDLLERVEGVEQLGGARWRRPRRAAPRRTQQLSVEAGRALLRDLRVARGSRSRGVRRRGGHR